MKVFVIEHTIFRAGAMEERLFIVPDTSEAKIALDSFAEEFTDVRHQDLLVDLKDVEDVFTTIGRIRGLQP